MNNLNYVALILDTLDENLDFIMLKEGYDISQNDFMKIAEAIKNEAIELDYIWINIPYEIWEFIIINSIDRYMIREYDLKTGKIKKKKDDYAEECVHRSLAESSPVRIPYTEYIKKRKNII